MTGVLWPRMQSHFKSTSSVANFCMSFLVAVGISVLDAKILTDDPASFRKALLNDLHANLSLFIVRKPHQHTDDALSLGRLRT